MFQIFNSQWQDIYWKREWKADIVVTDPPYNENLNFDAVFQQNFRRGMIVFCDPRNPQLEAPDELAWWVKPISTKNFSHHLGRFVEEIQVRYGTEFVFNSLHWSQMVGVYTDQLGSKPEHPFQKPLSLLIRLLRIYTNPGDVVFDPFMGSGMIGVAAKITNRGYIGCEQDAQFFELADRNIHSEDWAKFIG